jgi:hypothetical protein
MCGGAEFWCPPSSPTPRAVSVGYYTTPERSGTHVQNRTGEARCEEGYFCKSGIRAKCPPGKLCTFAESRRTDNLEVARITTQSVCNDTDFAYKGVTCVPCPPEGATCVDGRIELTEGFWYDHQTYGNLSDFWYKKFAGEIGPEIGLYRCPIGGGRCEKKDGLPHCKENHQGPLCSICEPGYFFSGFDGCEECPPTDKIARGVVVSVLVFFLLYKGATSLWARTKRRYPGADFTRLTYEAPQLLKLLTGVFQVVGSFQESFSAVPWPKNYRNAINAASALFNFDFFGTPAFACQSFGDNYQKRFLWHTLTTLTIWLTLVAALFLFEAKKKSSKKYKRWTTIVWNILLPFLFLVYPAVSKTTVLMLRCQKIDNKRYLFADFNVRCDEPEYELYRILGIVFTILYAVGIPVLFALLLALNRHNLPPDWWPDNMQDNERKAFAKHRAVKGNEWADRQEWRLGVWQPQMKRCHKFETRFGFLFNAYKHKYFWFESVISFYKFAMTTLVVFAAGGDMGSDTTLKILYLMFMATCLIALVSYLQPYKDEELLSVETMVNLEVLFVLFAALYLQEVNEASGSVAVGVCLLFLLVLPIVATMVLLAGTVREELSNALAKEKSSSNNALAKERSSSDPADPAKPGGSKHKLHEEGSYASFSILNAITPAKSFSIHNPMSRMLSRSRTRTRTTSSSKAAHAPRGDGKVWLRLRSEGKTSEACAVGSDTSFDFPDTTASETTASEASYRLATQPMVPDGGGAAGAKHHSYSLGSDAEMEIKNVEETGQGTRATGGAGRADSDALSL